MGRGKKQPKEFKPNNGFAYWTLYVIMWGLGLVTTYNILKFGFFTISQKVETVVAWNHSATHQTVGAFKHEKRILEYYSTELEAIYSYEFSGKSYHVKQSVPAYESIRMDVQAGAIPWKREIRINRLLPTFAMLDEEFWLLLEKIGIELTGIFLIALLRFWVGRTKLRIS